MRKSAEISAEPAGDISSYDLAVYAYAKEGMGLCDAENAYSRLPIGVHFRMDAEAGVELGHRVGQKVNKLPWKK